MVIGNCRYRIEYSSCDVSEKRSVSFLEKLVMFLKKAADLFPEITHLKFREFTSECNLNYFRKKIGLLTEEKLITSGSIFYGLWT